MRSVFFLRKTTSIKVGKLGVFFLSISYMNLLTKELDAVQMIC